MVMQQLNDSHLTIFREARNRDYREVRNFSLLLPWLNNTAITGSSTSRVLSRDLPVSRSPYFLFHCPQLNN